MSEQDNVRIVQAMYAAFGAGDLDTVLGHMADDIDWQIYGDPAIPFVGPRHGRDAVAANFQALFETTEFEDFKPEEFIAQGDYVVVLGHDHRRVKATGKTLHNHWAMVFTLRDSQVTRFRAYEESPG